MVSCEDIQAQTAGMRSLVAMDSDPDLPLMEAVAGQRDEAAFESLLQRHQSAAFNLALAMTGCRENAEEAVQNAMLKVWCSAGTFQASEQSTVRSWMLRVVAREALMLLRKSRREHAHKPTLERISKMGSTPVESGGVLELQETLGTLQAAVRHLSAPDRQLVVLAYGAEMSHHEIAQELAIPRRTISRRLAEILTALRTHLTEAGFAAAVPLINPQQLCAAILSGDEPGTGLKERILSRLGETENDTLHAASQQAVASKISGGVYLALAALATVAAGGVLLISWRETPSSIPAMPARPGVISAAQEQGKIYARWTFEKGPATDLKVAKGAWQWVPAQAGRPAGMEADSKTNLVPLPMPIPAGKCLEVSIRGTVLPSAATWLMMSARWVTSGQVPRRKIWEGPGLNFQVNTQLLLRTYLKNGWEVMTFWTSPTNLVGIRVCQYEPRAICGPQVDIVVSRTLVHEIEVREIAWSDVPERFRDLDKLTAELSTELRYPYPDLSPQAPDAQPAK